MHYEGGRLSKVVQPYVNSQGDTLGTIYFTFGEDGKLNLATIYGDDGSITNISNSNGSLDRMMNLFDPDQMNLHDLLGSMGVEEGGDTYITVKMPDGQILTLINPNADVTHADNTVTALSDYANMLLEGAEALSQHLGDTLSDFPQYLSDFAPSIISDLVMGGDLEEVAEQYALQIATTMGVDTLAKLFDLKASPEELASKDFKLFDTDRKSVV